MFGNLVFGEEFTDYFKEEAMPIFVGIVFQNTCDGRTTRVVGMGDLKKV